MTLLRSLVEMAAAQICGNCRQPMSGNHFYRKINGQNKRFCKKDAIQKAVAAGHNPSGNQSFPLGGTPPTGGPAQAKGGPVPSQSNTAPAPKQPPAPNTITRPQLENWLKDVGIEPDQYEVINGKLNIKTSPRWPSSNPSFSSRRTVRGRSTYDRASPPKSGKASTKSIAGPAKPSAKRGSLRR